MPNQIQGTYLAAATITANTAPSTSYLNRYDASSGALSVTLPALSGLQDGANMLLEKYSGDTSTNTVTFTRSGSDTFDDASTALVLSRPGERAWLQVITVSGTKYFSVMMMGETNPRGGIVAAKTQFALNTSNVATDIIAVSIPPGSLFAGSTYRIHLYGTVKVIATSGTLTFTPFIQNTALNTIQLASQTSAEGPVGFFLDITVTVRTTGASGSAIAHGFGTIRFATNTQINQILTSTNTAATTINTLAAGTPTLKCQATWATSNINNDLRIEIATIERIL